MPGQNKKDRTNLSTLAMLRHPSAEDKTPWKKVRVPLNSCDQREDR